MKRVLLLGDSIRMGYCGMVRQLLADQAEVVFPEENGRCTQYTLLQLGTWAAQIGNPEEIDVIHWNNGHWDAAHWGGDAEPINTPEIYARMLNILLRNLRRIFPKAQILFATTTPMNPDGSNSVNSRTTEQIMQYNEKAKAVMNAAGIPINDLFALAKDFPSSWYRDYCHYTVEGFQKLAEQVAETIQRYL